MDGALLIHFCSDSFLCFVFTLTLTSNILRRAGAGRPIAGRFHRLRPLFGWGPLLAAAALPPVGFLAAAAIIEVLKIIQRFAARDFVVVRV